MLMVDAKEGEKKGLITRKPNVWSSPSETVKGVKLELET